MIATDQWRGFFTDFVFPWGFHDPHEYQGWCDGAGLKVRRLELLPKGMAQQGPDGLSNWIRTTWMPYTERLPAARREEFVREAVRRYTLSHPADSEGRITVRMVRLELDAVKS